VVAVLFNIIEFLIVWVIGWSPAAIAPLKARLFKNKDPVIVVSLFTYKAPPKYAVLPINEQLDIDRPLVERTDTVIAPPWPSPTALLFSNLVL